MLAYFFFGELVYGPGGFAFRAQGEDARHALARLSYLALSAVAWPFLWHAEPQRDEKCCYLEFDYQYSLLNTPLFTLSLAELYHARSLT